MAAVPQAITDALALVQSDADATADAAGKAASAATDLATAQHANDTAASAVAGAQQQQKADLAALIALANTTYGG